MTTILILITNGLLTVLFAVLRYLGVVVLVAACAVLARLEIRAARRAAAKIHADRV